jgi:MFS family permease
MGFFFIALTYFLGYGLLVFPSSITGILKLSLHESDLDIGLLSSYFLIAYTLVQIPAGVMLDYYPIKRVVMTLSLCMALGCLIMGLSDHTSWIMFSRILMGLGAGMTFLACLAYGRIFFVAALFPLVTGIAEAMSAFGALGFNTAFSHLSHWVGWRTVILGSGAVIMLVCVLALLLVKVPEARRRARRAYPVRIQFSLLVRRPKILLVIAYAGLSFAHFMVLTNVWDITFLSRAYHIPVANAVLINALTVIGFALGGPLFGFLTRYRRPMRLLLAGGLAQAVLLMAAHYVPLPLFLNSIVLFLLGVATGSVVLLFEILKRFVPKQIYGMASGMLNMSFGATAIILTPVVSYIYQQTQDAPTAIFPVVIAMGLAIACGIALYLLDRQITYNPKTKLPTEHG